MILSISLSIIFLLVAFWHTDWNSVADDLSRLRWWVFIPVLLLTILHFILRAIRWRYLLPQASDNARVPTRALFDAIAIGNFASYVLPFRMGEFIRPYALCKWAPYGFGTTFVSVVIERFFDLSAVLLTLAIIAPFLPLLPPLILKGAITLGVLAVGILVFLTLLCIAPRFVRAVFFRPTENLLPAKIASPLVKFGEDLLAGAHTIRTPARLIAILFYTALIWASCYLQSYLFLYLFPDGGTILLAVTIAVFTALAVALPSAPGFIGVYQAGVTLAFSLFVSSGSVGVTYSIITHLFIYTFIIALGALALSRNDLSLSQLRSAATEKKSAV